MGLFLSSNAQDFIEDEEADRVFAVNGQFLSSTAQDFIEESRKQKHVKARQAEFLSSNAQDFIEDGAVPIAGVERIQIPEQ